MDAKTQDGISESMRELAHSIVDRELIIDGLNEVLKPYNLIVFAPFPTKYTNGGHNDGHYRLYTTPLYVNIGTYPDFKACFTACLEQIKQTEKHA